MGKTVDGMSRPVHLRRRTRASVDYSSSREAACTDYSACRGRPAILVAVQRRLAHRRRRARLPRRSRPVHRARRRLACRLRRIRLYSCRPTRRRGSRPMRLRLYSRRAARARRPCRRRHPRIRLYSCPPAARWSRRSRPRRHRSLAGIEQRRQDSNGRRGTGRPSDIRSALADRIGFGQIGQAAPRHIRRVESRTQTH